MKKTVCILLFLVSFTCLHAQESRFNANETAYVWANAGLNMREQPDAKSKKITVLPFAAKIIILEQMGAKIPFEVEEFEGFTVKGYWISVKFGEKKGWVFDGFLSKFTPPKESEGDIQKYLEAKFGKSGKMTDIKVQGENMELRPLKPNERFEPDTLEIYGFKQAYTNGVSLDYSQGEGGFSMIVSFQNMSLFEVYVIVKKIYFDAESNRFSKDKKTGALKMDLIDGGGCDFSIEKKGDKIVIEGGCGC
ncbi:MAG: hypothetical protein RL757_1419 [Bacteroidota bacterium]|jgi:hypothetical protein